ASHVVAVSSSWSLRSSSSSSSSSCCHVSFPTVTSTTAVRIAASHVAPGRFANPSTRAARECILSGRPKPRKLQMSNGSRIQCSLTPPIVTSAASSAAAAALAAGVGSAVTIASSWFTLCTAAVIPLYTLMIFAPDWHVTGTWYAYSLLLAHCTTPPLATPHQTTPHHTKPHRTTPHHTAPLHPSPHHTTPHRTTPPLTTPTLTTPHRTADGEDYEQLVVAHFARLRTEKIRSGLWPRILLGFVYLYLLYKSSRLLKRLKRHHLPPLPTQPHPTPPQPHTTPTHPTPPHTTDGEDHGQLAAEHSPGFRVPLSALQVVDAQHAALHVLLQILAARGTDLEIYPLHLLNAPPAAPPAAVHVLLQILAARGASVQ
ncbi:unnamed protein product, partial [Closterium sp. NIES-53]